MHTPRIGPRQIVYEDKVHRIYRVEADFGAFTKEYFVRDVGGHVGVVLRRDTDVLLVRQYRLLVDALSWEIPGGRAEEGEEPEVSAIRECLEETGFRCRRLHPLLQYHAGLDTLFNPTYLFHTADFEEVAGHAPDMSEVKECAWVPLPRCMEMIPQGEIVDGFTIIALLAYRTFVGW